MRKKEAEAYLTVYVALSLTALLSLFLVLLEGVRYNTIQAEAEIITDIAADSILAEYHREMLKQFGMFWVDTSYGTAQPSMEMVEQHMQGYLEKNCDSDVFLFSLPLYRDLLKMEPLDLCVEKAAVATDEGGRVFRQRAAEVVKDEIGLSFLEKIIEWLKIIEDNGLQGRDLEQEMQSVGEEIEALSGEEKQVGEEWVTVEIENPLKALEGQQRKGLLRQVLEEPDKVSSRTINLDTLVSSRWKREEINSGNWTLEEESLIDRLLWQEYLMRYCGHYGAESEEDLLQYQVEYLIAGKNSDTENLKSVAYRICAVRWAAAVMYLFTDETKCAAAEAVATAATTLLTVPEAASLVKFAILLGWAYAEGIYDVRCLFAGQKVPLLKSDDTWHYDLDGLLDSILKGIFDEDTTEKNAEGIDTGEQDGGGQNTGEQNASGRDSEEQDSEEQEQEGLTYQDYLRILLALSSLEEQTFRMMDIVEMDIRQTPGNENFRIDGCIDRLEAEVTIQSAYGYTVTIHKKKKY